MRVRSKGGQRLDIRQPGDMVDRNLHNLDPGRRLVVVNANASMFGNGGNLRHQLVRRIRAIARILTRAPSPGGSSPATGWSRCPSSARHAATRALAGTE